MLFKQEKDQLLDEAMDAYGHYLKRVVYSLVKDRQKAEDIVQEVFIRYYTSLEKFEGRATVKTYLYRIAINECHNYFKSWSYRKMELTQIFQQRISKETPENIILTNEENEAVGAIVGKLPLKYREVIWLYYYAEFSVGEVSEILKCSPNTVKTRLARGRKLAKINFEEDNDYELENRTR